METTYTYNSMNQLISRVDVMNEETYAYDKRGNLSLIMENGVLKNRYTYGAINRIEQAVNGKGDSALYAYNGLGHRTGRETNRGREDYLIDLTRPYHNMLMMTDAEKSQTFYWDGNVSAMSENRTRGTAEINAPDRATDRIASGAYGITPVFHYYLQDDLGSPIRVSGYNTGTEGKDNGYLTYGYDEFGNDLYDSLYNDMEDAGIPNPYSRQGEEQPFGYTGYRRDNISGTYFAQAREYQPQNGRFTAEDVIKGNVAAPETLNQYGYCWGNPLMLVDRDGKTAMPLVGPIGTGSYNAIERTNSFIEENIEEIRAGVQRASEFVEDVGRNIQNGWNAFWNKASNIWNNYIYGEDTIEIAEGPEFTNSLIYGKTVYTKTSHTGKDYIVGQNTVGTVNSYGVTIGIPKILNIGGSIGSDGINFSAYLGVEDVFEINGNLNIGSSSIIEFDGNEAISINGKMVGYGCSFGASPDSEVKAYLFSESLDDNGVNTHNEVGAHIKTELVYELAIILALPESALEDVVAYIIGLFGINAGALNNCQM